MPYQHNGNPFPASVAELPFSVSDLPFSLSELEYSSEDFLMLYAFLEDCYEITHPNEALTPASSNSRHPDAGTSSSELPLTRVPQRSDTFPHLEAIPNSRNTQRPAPLTPESLVQDCSARTSCDTSPCNDLDSLSSPASLAYPTAFPSPGDTLFRCIELVGEIASHLTVGEAAVISLVSWTFYNATQPFIHRALVTKFQNTLSREKKRRFLKVMHIRAHQMCDCSCGWRDFFAPRTVVIDLLDFDNFCEDKTCHTCAHVEKATRLVLIDNGYASEMSDKSQDYAVCGIPETVSDNVVVYWQRRGPRCGMVLIDTDLNFPAPPAPLPETDRRLTLVILPLLWDDDQPVSFREAAKGTRFNISLFTGLANYICENADRTFRIVGLEDANPFASPTHWKNRFRRLEAYQKEFMRGLAEYIWTNDHAEEWNEADRHLVLSRVTFTTFKDYLDSGEWRDELDPYTVGRWLNTYATREAAPRRPRKRNTRRR